MIVFSKILADKGTVWDAMRAREIAACEVPDDLIRFSSENTPVVMWNITRACNLKCKHCYLDAQLGPHPDELTEEEGKKLIDEFVDMGIPVAIVTGGEPLMSKNFLPYAQYAKEKGLRMVVSTNGTVITPELARKMKDADILYVGVSLDSADPALHDAFRGVEGAWKRSIEGIKNAMDAGLKTGLRITISKDNWKEVPALLDLAVEMGVPRFCMYHLVPTGRGCEIADWDITPQERIKVLEYLYNKAIELQDREIEILTTDSPMDGVYILERLKKEDPERFELARKLMAVSGGCSIGRKVANIDHLGNVSPCHFTPHQRLGNVKEKSFRDIWIDHPCDALIQLRNMKELLKGGCGICEYKDVCGGCRQKAYFYRGDLFEEDPTCIYDPEIGKLKEE
ncbi:MAG: radical SAM protein [Candidatus Syntropharchaeales archaeon]